MSRLLNFAMFYLGWFACVAGAAHGELWLGPSVVAALIVVHLYLTPKPIQETRLILVIGTLGFTIDTLQASAGLYAFTGTSVAPWLCPLWMVALWMIFATTLNTSMGWLAGRYRLAAALGALCGPASYAAGARLGAIELPAHARLNLLSIAIVWTCVMPTLLWLGERLSTSTARLPLPSPAARAGSC
jgi:Protein of unknown function (DUF2878)